jgi:hypothetical protein
MLKLAATAYTIVRVYPNHVGGSFAGATLRVWLGVGKRLTRQNLQGRRFLFLSGETVASGRRLVGPAQGAGDDGRWLGSDGG